MKEGRRGFLKKLGLAAAAPLAAIPAVAAPVSTETIQAFRFQCDCGENITAPVPKEEGPIEVKCDGCKKDWRLNWTGKFWKVKGSVGQG
jgi:hypothetical protein